MKKAVFMIMLLLAMATLVACSHEHVGGESCESSSICEICGKEYGEPLGHTYGYVPDKTTHAYRCTREGCTEVESRAAHSGGVATCTEAGFCTVCGAEYMDKLKHVYTGATCTELGTCVDCGESGGELLSHNYKGATCTILATCTVCGESGGELLSHNYEGATCSVLGVCTRCGGEGGRYLSHEYVGATCVKLGSCTMCGGEGGEYLSHSYEGATCTALGICETCGGEGGEYLPHDYAGATCVKLGNCTVCGGEGGKYSEVHSVPDGADACELCGVDYYSATLKFSLISGSEAYTVSGIGTCERDVIIVPDTYLGLPVIQISDYAFAFESDITEIRLPDSIVKIGKGAFDICTALVTVNIPDGITIIDNFTFAECASLSELEIPDSVTSIGASAFYGCTSLSKLNVPNAVTKIGESAFCGCKALTSLEIPSAIELIEISAFDDCTSLTYNTYEGLLYLGNSVDKYLVLIGRADDTVKSVTMHADTKIMLPRAFSETDIQSLTISEKLLYVPDEAFSMCTSLATPIIIPDSVKTIYYRAFYGCSSVPSLHIGKGVTAIDYTSFGAVGSLTSITVDAENTAYHSEDNCLIYTEQKLLLRGCKTSVIPSDGSVVYIGQIAFSKTAGMQLMIIPDAVVAIGYGAFSSCSDLEALVIGSGVEDIYTDACYGCEKLTSIYYMGTLADWKGVDLNESGMFVIGDNKVIREAELYCYSESEPTTKGNFWHYVDGVPTKW